MILVTIFRQPLTLGHTTRVLLHIMKLKMFQKSIKTDLKIHLQGSPLCQVSTSGWETLGGHRKMRETEH
jgi:hypothetical protein